MKIAGLQWIHCRRVSSGVLLHFPPFNQSCKQLTLFSHSPLLSNEHSNREEGKADQEKEGWNERGSKHHGWPHLFCYPAGFPVFVQFAESWDLDRCGQLGLINSTESQRPQAMLPARQNTGQFPGDIYIVYLHPGFNWIKCSLIMQSARSFLDL